MFRATLQCISWAAIASGMLRADFSYEQTSKVTGGAMAGMLKVAGALSRQAREPMRSTVSVKGDRMAHASELRTQIIDLSKETITTVDFQKKTFSVMTFAQMKQMLEQMSQKMKENPNADVHFKVSANATGKTRQMSGLEAKEMLLKMTMEGTDKQSGQQGAMVITSDIWMAPKAPGYDEVREFHRRMAEKLDWTPGTSMLSMGRSDIAKGMAEVYKEAAKIDGMPVLQEIRMGAEGNEASTAQPPSQTQTQTQTQASPSVSSTIGSALGGHFGLGRGKKKSEDSGQTGTPESGSLLEMTTETSNFSAAPVDDSRFEVPAGFKQVESELKRMH